MGEAFFRGEGVVGEDFFDEFAVVGGVDFHEVFDGGVGLVEPELVEVKNRGEVAAAVVGGGEPDGVAFALAEFATGHGVDDERGGPVVGAGVFEALDEVDAGGAVPCLVGAAEFEGDAAVAVEVEEIVALHQGVGKFGVGDAAGAFADAILDELAVEELRHAVSFADGAEEIDIFNIFEPVVVVDEVDFGAENTLKLSFQAGLVVFNFFKGLQVAFGVFLRIADLAGGATGEDGGFVAMAHETSAHHHGGEVADGHRVGRGVGAKIKLLVLTGVKFGWIFDGRLSAEAAPD